MNFITPNNKELLLQILEEHPLKDNREYFNQFFERNFTDIYRRRYDFNSNVIEMNKELIKRFAIIAKQISENNQSQEMQKKAVNNSRPNGNNFQNKRETMQSRIKQSVDMRDLRMSNKPDKSVTNNSIREERLSMFDEKLKQHQNDFIKLANPNKPDEIDFSDKRQEIKNRSFDDALKQREMELRQAMNGYSNSQKAVNWIGNDEIKEGILIAKDKQQKQNKSQEQGKNNKRRVRFNIEEINNSKVNQTVSKIEIDTNSFLKKLKKKHQSNKYFNHDVNNVNSMTSSDLDIDSMNIDDTINIEIGNNNGVLKQILNIIDEQKSKLSQLELLIKSLRK
jgi:hypothetical protein